MVQEKYDPREVPLVSVDDSHKGEVIGVLCRPSNQGYITASL